MAGPGAGSEVLYPMATHACPTLAKMGLGGFVLWVFLNNSRFALGCKMYEFGLYLSNAD